jgi:hypothetical protein
MKGGRGENEQIKWVGKQKGEEGWGKEIKIYACVKGWARIDLATAMRF